MKSSIKVSVVIEVTAGMSLSYQVWVLVARETKHWEGSVGEGLETEFNHQWIMIYSITPK